MCVGKVDFGGLDKELNTIQSGAKELVEMDGAPIDQLFHRSFMRQYTSFPSIDELFDASGLEINSPESLDAILDDAWDKYIASTTQFSCWEDMKNEAFAQYMAQKLGF